MSRHAVRSVIAWSQIAVGAMGIAFGAIPMLFARFGGDSSVEALAYPVIGDRWYVWAAIMTIAALVVVGLQRVQTSVVNSSEPS